MSQVYFDNAATTFPKPEIVYSFMNDFYRNYGVNVGRGQYALASYANNIVNETRQLLLELFKCNNSKQVIFTPSATEATNVILQGYKWNGGENVYITHLEHNAVLRTLNCIKEKYNINIYYLPFEKEYKYDLEKVQHCFQNNKPNVIIMNHASNVFGYINPIEGLSNLAKHYEADVIVDASQTAGLIDIDMSSLNIDYLIFAGHKTLYGPLGIAGFITSEAYKLRPLIYGGTGIDSANIDMPQDIPSRFEAGSMNILSISGLNSSLKWIKSVGRENILIHEKKLTNELIKKLETLENIKIFKCSDSEDRIGIVSIIINGLPVDITGQLLNESGFAVRTGLHCAPDAHKFLGTFPSGTIRISLGYFNTLEQIEWLVQKIQFITNNC